MIKWSWRIPKTLKHTGSPLNDYEFAYILVEIKVLTNFVERFYAKNQYRIWRILLFGLTWRDVCHTTMNVEIEKLEALVTMQSEVASKRSVASNKTWKVRLEINVSTIIKLVIPKADVFNLLDIHKSMTIYSRGSRKKNSKVTSTYYHNHWNEDAEWCY